MMADTKGQVLEMEEEETEQDEVVLDEAPKAPTSARGAMARYDVQVLLMVLVLYTLPFLIARSSFYEKTNLSFYSRPLNYAYETPVKDADVIVFGDSTALFGVDPSRMESALGMKVVNLPNTHGSLLVNNDLPLQRYLAKNKAPKLIVFYFAPWDFDYGNVNLESIHVFEGEELLARQGTGGEIWSFVRKKPVEALLFPLRFYADFLQFFSHRVSHVGQEDTLQRTHGWIENVDQTVLASPCTFPPLLLENIRFNWVKALGQKYRTAGTDVAFYAAPVPNCANVAEVMNHDYASLPAKPPVQIPAQEFVRDVRYIHPHAADVPELTDNVIAVVRPKLAGQR